MVIEIFSDADLPRCLSTKSKQVAKARQLANSLNPDNASKKAERAWPLGFFSRTVIVTLKNGDETVIQFRPEPLILEPFYTARKVLGSAVPEIKEIQNEELISEGIWTYYMTRVSGKTWLEVARGKSSQIRVTTVRSLARILSKGYVGEDYTGDGIEMVVDKTIYSHLKLILASDDPKIRQFHQIVTDLLDNLEQLKQLPLFVSHFDLNDINIMVDEKNWEVTGLIDWELSTPLPLGMGLCRIHTLAGEFSEQKFYMPPEFEEAEKVFWQEFWNGLPGSISSRLKPETVQMAVTLGTILDAFQLDEGKIGGYNNVVMDALPKFLTYRIPAVRGEGAPPYSG